MTFTACARRAGAGFALSCLLGLAGCGGPAQLSTQPPGTPPTSPRVPESGSSRARADEAASHPEPAALTTFAPEPLPETNALPIPDGTTVLHIGDSFAGALGLALNPELEARNVRSVLRYKTSSYIPTWAFSGDVPRYLARSKPDLVLITLGANELDIPEPGQRARQIRRLIDRLGGVPCVWIAPPLWPAAQHKHALLQIIRESCAPCRYLDSTTLVGELPRLRDGIHPSTEGRETWAKAVLDWLARERDPAGSRPWTLKAEIAPATSAASR